MSTPKFDFQQGETLLIAKPFEWTSFDVVNKVRYAVKRQSGLPRKTKVGHAGTLDPLATGLLILCTGKATKKLQDFTLLGKEYTGTITLGATTPSFDLETEVDQTFSLEDLTEEKIKAAVEKLTGKIQQIPPAYSAKRIDGEKAYFKIRKGEVVKLPPREVEVYEFEITSLELPEIHFRISCSKGTYIRSLARDLGELLNNGGHLTALCRTRVGDYKLEDAWNLEDLIDTIQALPRQQIDI